MKIWIIQTIRRRFSIQNVYSFMLILNFSFQIKCIQLNTYNDKGESSKENYGKLCMCKVNFEILLKCVNIMWVMNWWQI